MKSHSKLLLIISLLVLGSCASPTSDSTSLDDTSNPTSGISISDGTSLITTSETPVTSTPVTSTPVTSTPTTSQEFNGYYNSVNLEAEGTTLLNALKTLVNSGFVSGSYSNAWNVAKIGDQDINNANNIIQIYSRFTRPKSEQNSGSGEDNWNREHVVPKSAMNNCSTDVKGPCTDYHNLWASDTKVNATRGNNKFGVVSSGAFVKDSKGRETPARLSGGIFDPNSEARGEVARATFYMIIKWNFSTTINGNFNTLLEWNRQYPPTAAREIKRNNAVYNAQHNRNPFIDYPQLADAIWA